MDNAPGVTKQVEDEVVDVAAPVAQAPGDAINQSFDKRDDEQPQDENNKIGSIKVNETELVDKVNETNLAGETSNMKILAPEED